jgi:signal transduction histidine kinase
MTPTLCFAILAPFGRDGQLIEELLASERIESLICGTVGEVCDAILGGVCDGIVLTEEALPPHAIQVLLTALSSQAAWSDIPIAVMVSGGTMTRDMAALIDRLGASTNLTYIERPVRAATLHSIFNAMMRARLRQYEVRDLLSAHAAAEEAERAAREQAEQATRMRDEFLGVASHELRTPLTVMLGQTQRLARKARNGGIEGEALLSSLDDVYKNARRLEELISDLLDTSRIQQERLMLHPTPIVLESFAGEIVERFRRELPPDSPHRLVLESSGSVTGRWDEGRLDQVLTNLLSNAIKYSPEGGTITLRVCCEGDDAIVEVSDEGIGIPADRIGDLFQPFVRLHENYRVVNGTGLGLYITEQLVRRHGGHIDVASEPSRGTRFTIHLPLHWDAPSDGADEAAHEVPPAPLDVAFTAEGSPPLAV